MQALAKASRGDLSTGEATRCFDALAEETADAYIVLHHLVEILGEETMKKTIEKKVWKFKRSLYGDK